jgi:hypothetical protein
MNYGRLPPRVLVRKSLSDPLDGAFSDAIPDAMSLAEDVLPSRAALLGPPVIDARAPRFNQAIIGGAALAAFLLGWWPLLALAALQLALTLSFGPRLVRVLFGEAAMGYLLGRLGCRQTGVQVVAHLQPTALFQIALKTASEFFLPAGAHDGVAITLLAKFEFDETIQHLLAVHFACGVAATASGCDCDDKGEPVEQTHCDLYRKK